MSFRLLLDSRRLPSLADMEIVTELAGTSASAARLLAIGTSALISARKTEGSETTIVIEPSIVPDPTVSSISEGGVGKDVVAVVADIKTESVATLVVEKEVGTVCVVIVTAGDVVVAGLVVVNAVNVVVTEVAGIVIESAVRETLEESTSQARDFVEESVVDV